MFGRLGPTELIVIGVVVLFVVGPGRLPKVARSLTKGYKEYKKTTNEIKDSLKIIDIDRPTKKS